jgi:hypothetical protein
MTDLRLLETLNAMRGGEYLKHLADQQASVHESMASAADEVQLRWLQGKSQLLMELAGEIVDSEKNLSEAIVRERKGDKKERKAFI